MTYQFIKSPQISFDYNIFVTIVPIYFSRLEPDYLRVPPSEG